MGEHPDITPVSKKDLHDGLESAVLKGLKKSSPCLSDKSAALKCSGKKTSSKLDLQGK